MVVEWFLGSYGLPVACLVVDGEGTKLIREETTKHLVDEQFVVKEVEMQEAGNPTMTLMNECACAWDLAWDSCALEITGQGSHDQSTWQTVMGFAAG